MKIALQDVSGWVPVSAFVMAAVLSFSSSSSQAGSLPVLGYKYSQNGVSIHIMPARMKAVENQLRVSGPVLEQVLSELNREVTEAGRGCRDRIIEIVSNSDYDSVKPLVVFEGEINPAIVSCIVP